MANVLPQSEQKIAWKIFRARLALALALVLGLSALISVGAFVPSYIMLTLGAPRLSSPADVAQNTAHDAAAVAETQTLVSRLYPLVAASTTPSQVIDRTISLKPAGVSITGFSYQPGQVVVTGVARSPSALQTYQQALMGDPTFTRVVVPIDALVGNSSGVFTITLSGTF